MISMNLKSLLKRNIKICPNKIAFIQDGDSYTYKEIFDIINLISIKLKKYKIGKCKKVLILIKNPLLFIIALFSVIFTGGIVIPIYYQTGLEKIKLVLKKYDIEFILADFFDDTLEFNYKETLYEDLGQLLLLKNKTNIKKDNSLKGTSLILLSSGTTNLPKAIQLSDESIFCNVLGISKYLKLTSEDKIFLVKSLNHASTIIGELFVSIWNRCTVYLTSNMMSARGIIDILEKEQITVFFAVPLLLNNILKSPKINNANLDNLRIINFYGDKAKTEDIVLFDKILPKINLIYSYGLTEASPRVSYIEKKDLLLKLNSSGKTIENVSVRIKDKEGNILKANEIGEIVVAGKNVMIGYYKDRKRTKKTIKNRELFTGDIGYLAEDNFLYVIGRKDNMVISAGRNIYLEEIETVLEKHIYVKEALVVNESSENDKISLIAYVVANEFDEESVLNFCRENLETYKCPKEIRFVNALDKTITGKIRRNIS